MDHAQTLEKLLEWGAQSLKCFFAVCKDCVPSYRRSLKTGKESYSRRLWLAMAIIKTHLTFVTLIVMPQCPGQAV